MRRFCCDNDCSCRYVTTIVVTILIFIIIFLFDSTYNNNDDNDGNNNIMLMSDPRCCWRYFIKKSNNTNSRKLNNNYLIWDNNNIDHMTQTTSITTTTTNTNTNTTTINHEDANDNVDIDNDTDNNDNIFIILGGNRSGLQWIVSILNEHPDICISSKINNHQANSNEKGEDEVDDSIQQHDNYYPYNILSPLYNVTTDDSIYDNSININNNYCSQQISCMYFYIRDTIQQLVIYNQTEYVCQQQSSFDKHTSPIILCYNHIPILCQYIQKLNRNYTEENIFIIWMNAYIQKDQQLFNCTCNLNVNHHNDNNNRRYLLDTSTSTSTIKKRKTKKKHKKKKLCGIKIMIDWITYPNYPSTKWGSPELNLNHSYFDNRKVIQIKRSNIWTRYKSYVIASIYHQYNKINNNNNFNMTNETQFWEYMKINYNKDKNKISSTNDYTNNNNDIMHLNFYDMKFRMLKMLQYEYAADEWIKDHAMDVMKIDYDECQYNTLSCLNNIYQFLNISSNTINHEDNVYLYDHSLRKTPPTINNLQYINSKNEVELFMKENNWEHYFIEYNNYNDDSNIEDNNNNSDHEFQWTKSDNNNGNDEVHLLIYDPDEMFDITKHLSGFKTQFYGSNNNNNNNDNKKSNNYRYDGNMFVDVIPILEKMIEEQQSQQSQIQYGQNEKYVIISSNRDMIVKYTMKEEYIEYEPVHEFINRFENNIHLHYPNSILISTTTDCCPTSLTHNMKPGQDLFHINDTNTGLYTRNKRACLSGQTNDCLWEMNDEYNTVSLWKDFMMDISKQRYVNYTNNKNIYLDGSLLCGKIHDVLRIIKELDIQMNEDPRAVLIDYMYLHPESIILDYNQTLFGPFRQKVGTNINHFACSQNNNAAIIPVEKQIYSSLFLYTPKLLGCQLGQYDIIPSIFPRWGSSSDGGIDNNILLLPLIEHIERVANDEVMIVSEYGYHPDYSLGPEIPYIMNSNGIYTSRYIRFKSNEGTIKWRQTPIEELYILSYQTLINHIQNNDTTNRWKFLQHIIRNDIGFIFWAYYGDYKYCNYHNYYNVSIPIYTLSAQNDINRCNYSYPIPNYMLLENVQQYNENWIWSFQDNNNKYPWLHKKQQIVWRGSLSIVDNPMDSPRWQITKLVYEKSINKDWYDIGITDIPTWILDNNQDINISEIGGLVEPIYPMSSFMEYRAILDMDGNSWSSRFILLLSYNSIIVKVEPDYVEYYYPDIKPWTHYIPIKSDLSDFNEIMEWIFDINNDEIINDIILAANQFVSERLTPNDLAYDMLDIWESYVRRLVISVDDDNNSSWENIWKSSWKTLLLESEKYDFVLL